MSVLIAANKVQAKSNTESLVDRPAAEYYTLYDH